MSKISITINNNKVTAHQGGTVLDVCEELGIKIPTLCHSKAITPYGACRLCLVDIKINGKSRLRASCTYKVTDGLSVQTDTEIVHKTRKIMAELLLARCPDSEKVKEIADELGVKKVRFPRKNEDCILCGLCVRVCHELMKTGAIDFYGRGDTRKVGPAYDKQSPICMVCGACKQICPVNVVDLEKISKRKPRPVPSAFDSGLKSQASIYIPFPQALPKVPVINRSTCLNFRADLCKACEKFCPAGAIDYDQEDEIVEIEVGAAILSPGYCLFDAGQMIETGYAWYSNVVSSLQFERLLSASGPYEGKIVRPSDLNRPRNIAFIQCVGSRDSKRNYCSSVCCMYATKEAIIAMEHEEGLGCSIFYMDLRAFGKGFDVYYERAKELGVEYIRCRPSSIEQDEETKNLTIGYIDEKGHFALKEFDLVVLSTGLTPSPGAKELAEKFGIELNNNGFAKTTKFNPVESTRDGIYVCGPFSEPKDIPETVMEASSASSKAMALLSEKRGSLVFTREWPAEKNVAGLKPRIGVFICHCGKNIGGVVNVPSVCEYASTLPDVVIAQDNLYTCSIDTQEIIKQAIFEHGLNRVVVASCTPRTHEPLFRDTIREAGLNPYLFEMANIRDQCSWVHMHNAEEATRKSKDLLRMAIAKARLIEPLYSISIAVKSGALVLGGGIAGMTAALNLADQGFVVNLVEKDKELGGNMRHIYYLLGNIETQYNLKETIDRVKNHKNIKAWLSSTVNEVNGFVGNFETKIKQNGKTTALEHGVVIVATGAKEHTPVSYHYGSDKRVITQRELEEKLFNKDLEAKRVVMIQCVESREGDRIYCSRVCCSQAIKNAIKIKDEYPDTDVYILYREIRSYGFREEYYTQARNKGIKFVRYNVNEKPEIDTSKDRLKINITDPILKNMLQIDSDLLVLAPAIVPQDDVSEVAKMLKLPLTKNKFFLEAHMKLRPVDFSVDGVYLAGMAHAPKNIEETIAQAEAAASRACTVIAKTEYIPEAIVAKVDEEVCSACGICVSICSYDAPEIIINKGKSFSLINKALCKGCGACSTACPSGAIKQFGFKPNQIMEMVSASLEE